MNKRPMILLVEDDDLSAVITTKIIGSDYLVHHARNGQEALDFVARQLPDLVMLDVSMPGLSGYDVCRLLRNDAATREVPIIFLSGMVSEEDHLAGYQAGGDDYLNKPPKKADLLQKIRLLLDHHAENVRLKQELSESIASASTAILSATDMTILFHFFQASFTYPDYESLCRGILKTLNAYGVDGSVQIRGILGTISFGANGPSSPLETSVLSNLAATYTRTSQFSSCMSYSHNHVTIIVRNTDKLAHDLFVRLNENLALLAEGANMRVIALDSSAKLEQANQQFNKLFACTRLALTEMAQQQVSNNDQVLLNLQHGIKNRLTSMELPAQNKNELTSLIKDAHQALTKNDYAYTIATQMNKIKDQL